MSESFKTRTAFIMASVGSAVGLGNIFRFPALAVKYGLAFIIVYTILLFTIGIPMLSAELAVGRKFSMSAVGSARKILKKAEFAGWLAAANSFVIASYYCVLFSMVLLCAVFSYRLYDMSVDGMLVFKDILYTSQLRIEVVLGLVAAWAAVYLCFGRAEKLGIISTVSVIFAVVVIFLLAVWRGLSSSDQLNSFLRFDVGVLYSRGFWGDVSGQVFFSLSVAVGAMISYGAFLHKKENIAVCGVIIGVCDLAVSIFATVIYATVPKTDTEGGLLTCFSVYPEAFMQLGGGLVSAIVSFLFYLSLALLCLDSVIAYLKSITHCLEDRFSVLQERSAVKVIGLAAFLGFFMLGAQGSVVLAFADGIVAKFLTLSVALIEMIIFGYVLGTGTIAEEMGIKNRGAVERGFAFSIKIFAPAVLAFLFLREFIF